MCQGARAQGRGAARALPRSPRLARLGPALPLCRSERGERGERAERDERVRLLLACLSRKVWFICMMRLGEGELARASRRETQFARAHTHAQVTHMRTAGPIHTGARLPRLRPLTPLESPRHRKFGADSVEYPRRGTAKTAKSVAFQVCVSVCVFLYLPDAASYTCLSGTCPGPARQPLQTQPVVDHICKASRGWPCVP